jgi:membrane protein DedA with SNARE-associated domain
VDKVVGTILQWLDQYGLIVLFVMMLCKNCAIIGLVVPGTTTLVITGFLAGNGRLSIVSVILVACAGVLAGNNLSYALGRFANRFVIRTDRVSRAADTANEWLLGKRSLLLFFQFPVYIRVLLPLGLGTLWYPLGRWLIIDVAATGLFVGSVALLGYLAGSLAYEMQEVVTLSQRVQVIIGLWVLISVVAMYLLWYVRKTHR